MRLNKFVTAVAIMAMSSSVMALTLETEVVKAADVDTDTDAGLELREKRATVGLAGDIDGEIILTQKKIDLYLLKLKLVNARTGYEQAATTINNGVEVNSVTGMPDVMSLPALTLGGGIADALPAIAHISGMPEHLMATVVNPDGSVEYASQGDVLSSGYTVDGVTVDGVTVRKGFKVKALRFSMTGAGSSMSVEGE